MMTKSENHEEYRDPQTTERLDIVHTPNGWVRPQYAEVEGVAVSEAVDRWTWKFDAPVSGTTYMRTGFVSKIEAARDCYNFAGAMCAGEIESRETRR